MEEIKNGFKRIRDSIPYIPNFRDISVLLKIIIGSFYILTMYTLVEVDSISKFYSQLIQNIRTLGGYLTIEILALWLFGKIIENKSSIVRILIILLITAVNVYIISTVQTDSFDLFFLDYNKSIKNMMVSTGLVFFFIIYFDWYEKNVNPAQMKAKLISLQSKMKPHFLFNTINTIIYLIRENPELAGKMLINLSEIFRESLFDDDTNLSTINDELIMCEKYLELEKIRLGGRLSYDLSHSECSLDWLLPKYSLQPIVENAILHGIQNQEDGGRIDISVTEENKLLVLTVENTSSNSNIKIKAGNGLSLDNLDKRLNMIFNGKYKMETIKSDKTYKVVLIIPKRGK